MQDKLQQLKSKVLHELKAIKNSDALRDLEVKYLGRKGELTEILKGLKDLANEEKPKIGALANDVKKEIEEVINNAKWEIDNALSDDAAIKEKIDVTLPSGLATHGHLHPLTQVQKELEELFKSLGFFVATGPDLESEWFNFDALNIPASHPARDMQDTFFVDGNSDTNNRWLLRTQTSPVQIRSMLQYGVPLRVIVPGKCFRNEATDARHEHTFHQLEGLMVDKNISLANMKAILEAVAKKLYGESTKIRLRPKFYPFVEPGVNGEVTCFLCRGTGCRVCKQTGWLEIFGAGMVHPDVLRAGGVNPDEYSGFAFGFGLTRLVMLKYGIDDIRLLMSGDKRFLDQF